MTASFVDVMVIDSDTFAFLWQVFPHVRAGTVAGVAVALPIVVAVMADRSVPHAAAHGTRGARRPASLRSPGSRSPFRCILARPSATAITFPALRAPASMRCRPIWRKDSWNRTRWSPTDCGSPPIDSCPPAGPRPHIILVHDESSFDIRMVDGRQGAARLRRHFRSFDGKERKFLVEGAGGPSWYTEYNVLAGLVVALLRPLRRTSSRASPPAASTRGLPNALKRCGYRTFSVLSRRSALF